jgi:hypothetical protein
VEESDQITHLVMLSEEHKAEQTLDVFKFDPDFEANESKCVLISLFVSLGLLISYYHSTYAASATAPC